MDKVYDEKKTARSRIRKQMRALDPAVREKTDVIICRNAARLPEFQKAKTIFCFVAYDWEIDTTPLIELALHEGKRVAVPLCTGPGIMEARFITGLSELTPGAYGIPEPSESAPMCPVEEIELALVPCVSCDSACMRLGQGGGFYDRFMEHASFCTAALCREAAMMEKIPAEPWDRPVDHVITEVQTISRKK